MKPKKDKETMTLREHYVKYGSYDNGAENLGITSKTYGFWLCKKNYPRFDLVKMLIRHKIDLTNFPD